MNLGKPNSVLYALAAAVAASALTAALLVAHAHGKRQERRAWLMDRRPS